MFKNEKQKTRRRAMLAHRSAQKVKTKKPAGGKGSHTEELKKQKQTRRRATQAQRSTKNIPTLKKSTSTYKTTKKHIQTRKNT